MNIIKTLAETIIAGGSLLFPPLALAQPLLSPILDKAPDSEHLKTILKKLIDKGADLEKPKEAFIQNATELEKEIKAYYCEVLDELNKPTEKINVQNAGIQDIYKSLLTANNIDIKTFNKGKTLIEKSNISGNNEINITTHSGGHTKITESIVGKNGGMKTSVPNGWIVDQPSGWVQKYNPDGSFSIGTIGNPTGSFTIGHNGNPTGNFVIYQEKKDNEKDK